MERFPEGELRKTAISISLSGLEISPFTADSKINVNLITMHFLRRDSASA
jgi:hypothetical protein